MPLVRATDWAWRELNSEYSWDGEREVGGVELGGRMRTLPRWRSRHMDSLGDGKPSRIVEKEP